MLNDIAKRERELPELKLYNKLVEMEMEGKPIEDYKGEYFTREEVEEELAAMEAVVTLWLFKWWWAVHQGFHVSDEEVDELELETLRWMNYRNYIYTDLGKDERGLFTWDLLVEYAEGCWVFN